MLTPSVNRMISYLRLIQFIVICDSELSSVMEHPDSNPEDLNSSIWVFGYGSLCWHPGFDYDKSTTGYVKGYTRKFWQGNDQHRGTRDNVSIPIQNLVVMFSQGGILVFILCKTGNGSLFLHTYLLVQNFLANSKLTKTLRVNSGNIDFHNIGPCQFYHFW